MASATGHNNPFTSKIKLIYSDGVISVSACDGKCHYRSGGLKDPAGKVFEHYNPKPYRRGTILKKLSIWE